MRTGDALTSAVKPGVSLAVKDRVILLKGPHALVSQYSIPQSLIFHARNPVQHSGQQNITLSLSLHSSRVREAIIPTYQESFVLAILPNTLPPFHTTTCASSSLGGLPIMTSFAYPGCSACSASSKWVARPGMFDEPPINMIPPRKSRVFCGDERAAWMMEVRIALCSGYTGRMSSRCSMET